MPSVQDVQTAFIVPPTISLEAQQSSVGALKSMAAGVRAGLRGIGREGIGRRVL